MIDDIFQPRPPMELPTSAYERALMLRNGLINEATGGSFDVAAYKLLRSEFMQDPEARRLLPQYVRTCNDTGDFWQFIKHEFATYEERRVHLRSTFGPLLEFLENRGSPAVEMISDVLMSYDEDGVHRAWQKSLRRSADDPEGAITAARALLESVCKHILEEGSGGGEILYGGSDDLPKLYRMASEKLNLAPSQHTEEVFRRVLGGCSSVVEGLGSLRNKVGDAHGQGKRPVRVQPRHAHLAVNLAGAMAMFLIETLAARTERQKKSRA
jgi:hypothetical protein